jgi:hypothetical protein
MRIHQPRCNNELLETQGRTYTESEDIRAMHMALGVYMAYHNDNGPWSSAEQEEHVQVVTRLEYILQDLWGFNRSMEKHTWVNLIDIDKHGNQV